MSRPSSPLGRFFQDYLAQQLRQRLPEYDLSEHPSLVEEDVRTWDRRFDKIEKRYRDFAGIALGQLPSWIRSGTRRSCATLWCTNQGQYTRT